MNAVWAARQAGAERIVRLSVVGAAHDAPNRSGRLHALSDRETERCGMRWTILRPLWFMQNLLNEAGDVSATGAFSLNMGSARIGMWPWPRSQSITAARLAASIVPSCTAPDRPSAL